MVTTANRAKESAAEAEARRHQEIIAACRKAEKDGLVWVEVRALAITHNGNLFYAGQRLQMDFWLAVGHVVEGVCVVPSEPPAGDPVPA